MPRGWVYIIANKALPDLLKIGFTLRTPDERAAELGNTGVPQNYEVIYAIEVYQPRRLEQSVHRSLGTFHEGKEWFRCHLNQAISAIQEAAGQHYLAESAHHAEAQIALADLDLARRREAKNQAYTEALNSAIREEQNLVRGMYLGKMSQRIRDRSLWNFLGSLFEREREDSMEKIKADLNAALEAVPGYVRICRNCSQANRIAPGEAGQICGKCHSEL